MPAGEFSARESHHARQIAESFGSEAERYARTRPATSYAPLLDKAIDGVGQTGRFSEPEQWQFDWERRYARDEWLEQVPTFGGHSQIPAEKLAELLAGIGDVLDAAGGSFIMGYTAVVLTARRVDAV